jgi:hypothetical protein
MQSPNTDRIAKLGERLTHLQQGINKGKSDKLAAVEQRLKNIDSLFNESQDNT